MPLTPSDTRVRQLEKELREVKQKHEQSYKAVKDMSKLFKETLLALRPTMSVLDKCTTDALVRALKEIEG